MGEQYFGFNIDDREFESFRDLIYRESGIKLRDNKKDLLRQRLNKRIRALGLSSYGEYLQVVEADRTRKELTEMIDAVSTNVTSFFREIKHFEFLRDRAIPEIIKRKSGVVKEIRVWSAACSSGEEPYSILFTLLAMPEVAHNWKVKLLATDISTKVLQKAMKGSYPADKVETLPDSMLREYFDKGHGEYTVKPAIREMVHFRWYNLIAARFPFRRQFDVIFCRNVMIYFDKPTREELIRKFASVMAPGGYLCIGHSESLANTNHPLKYIQPTIYMKE